MLHDGGPAPGAVDFIRARVARDLASGVIQAPRTRFPPEPNGFLHLGHAKSAALNFGIAEQFGGVCHLRMDDTNPAKESQEFVDAIERDLRWLGFDWGPRVFFASDNFEQLYQWAILLIKNGKAYVDEQSVEQIRLTRGTLTEPGSASPYRDRPIAENLKLFARMRRGDFAAGACALRAKIDMAAGNVNLRDPVLYRISHVPHPRTGDAWPIYPSYDFAHGQTDALEGITHSIATLEFEDHKPLYDWLLDQLPVRARPRQHEFARLEITHTLLSKRALSALVAEGIVRGWDDPRMPTLAGLRRRGVPAEAIRDFVGRIGVSKANSVVDLELFEAVIRETLNRSAERRMAVLRPLELVLENLPEGAEEELIAPNHPEDSQLGSRTIRLRRRLFIEREDFSENPPKGFNRLAPGRETRLRYAFVVKCIDVEKDARGEVTKVICSYDPATRGGDTRDGRKVKGTIHWVDAASSVEAQVRLVERLFLPTRPTSSNLREQINPTSLEIISGCRVEPSAGGWPAGRPVQFERQGYFALDLDSGNSALVFNRTIALRETWNLKTSRKGVRAMLNKKSLQSTLVCLAAKQLEQSRRAYAEYLAGASRDPTEAADHQQASHAFGNAEIAEYFEGPTRSYEASLDRLRAIDFGPKGSVEEGAAVRIDGRWFVIGVATQAFTCEGESYMGISTEAPIYAALAGARAGEAVRFRGRELVVESVG